ncbi:hypothetical protein HanIR_Chr04g0151351 [Helianthus annuus]|nr:hypothetical protein HanIR_Chr04g0151351 [Helianthus annuus]
MNRGIHKSLECVRTRIWYISKSMFKYVWDPCKRIPQVTLAYRYECMNHEYKQNYEHKYKFKYEYTRKYGYQTYA